MLAFSCSFCHHVNPPGSKFCNECGSPLRLMPCLQCAAVNDLGSATCHQCGAPLAPPPASPRPVEHHAASFEERLEALRRDLGALRETPVGVRPAASGNVALAPATLAERSLEAWQKHGAMPPVPTTFGTTTAFSSIAPALSNTPHVAAPSSAVSPILPAAPSKPALEAVTATEPRPGAEYGERGASPPGLATLRPAAPEPAEPRTIPPRLLYVLGAGLILIGVGGYLYSLYGASDPIKQWLGTLRQTLASESSAVKAPPESNAPAGDAAPSSGSGEAGVAPRSDDAATATAGVTAPSSPIPLSETARPADANPAPAQTIAGTTTESPAASSAIQTAPATAAATADASNAPPVAAAPTKHTSRAKRRAGKRKTAPSHSASVPQ